jgi:hypothetical protein
MSLIKKEKANIADVFNNYIQNFESIYIEQLYNIIYNKNTDNIYSYITKYIKSSKRKIIDCIKKNRFSINDLMNTINKYKQKFVFLLNLNTKYNNNMNNIIFNELIIEQNISLLIYSELYSNNIKLHYFLKNTKPFDNKNIDIFNYSYNKYIIEMLKLNIIESDSLLYNNMILHYHIILYNKKSKLFIQDNNYLESIIIKNYNNLFQKEEPFIFIINNINYLANLATKYYNKPDGVKFIKLIISKCILDERLYEQNINIFTKYFINIMQTNMNVKYILSLFINNNIYFTKFITIFTYIIYEFCNSNKIDNINFMIYKVGSIITDYHIFKIKFFEKIKEINTKFLLNCSKKILYSKDNILAGISPDLYEYINNIYNDFVKFDNNCIINPYYWSINNSEKYIIDEKNNKHMKLNHLHMGKTIINFNYMNNVVKLTMLPLQFHIFSYFNEHMKFPDKLGTYNKNDITKVIKSFTNSNLIIFNDNKYTINDDIKNINTNLIDIYYNSDNTSINSTKKSTFVMDIKYIIATNIKKFLKIKANNFDNIYKYLVDKLNIDIYNITNKQITNTLEYMIKQDYIYHANNMYHNTIY